MAADGVGGISRAERWSLAGTAALVTGSSKGIGHAIVEELAGFGATVHTCSRNAAELEECRRRWEEKGLPVTVSVCDVSVRAEREKLVETVNKTFDGKLDILVNNAGQMPLKAAVEWTADEYSQLMTTNLESCFHLCQLAHPLLIHASIAGGSSIVNISSISGSIAYKGVALYAISKGTPDSSRRNQIAPFKYIFPCDRLFNN
ncbi:noroxomaritidine/norcraugsodine reductase-like [Lolium rigidum]|uniref:noroxomaritidine/norcraugsodine reductase-like n=1 Tax=Lolium rigidum TaxID=89674 RepID=UPI001F5E0195|nr:noroxomaritidine/norcraugsodine reductase-like [Lolium rigidum]